MGEHGYNKTTSDHCVFVKKFSDEDFIILLLYVDDMLIVGHDVKKIDKLKKELGKTFSMKDLGSAKQILGIKITRDRKAKKLWLSQERYIEKVLERFHMDKSKPVGSPLANHFKLSYKQSPLNDVERKKCQGFRMLQQWDIAHAVGVVSRFLSNLGREHWAAVLNGYLDTFVALPNYVFILGTESHCKKALQMGI